MKNYLFVTTLLCCAVLPVSAQLTKTERREIRESRKELVREMRTERSREAAGSNATVTTTEVGEVDSFDKNVKFLGIASSGAIYVYFSCDPAILLADLGLVLGVDDRCLAAPDPAVTANATFDDVARINLPAKAATNIVYMINNHSNNWQFLNSTAGNVSKQ